MAQATHTCTIADCDRPRSSRGWCKSHVERWRRWGDPTVDRRKRRTFCTVEGCDGPTKGNGLCELHYRRARNGTVVKPCSAPDCTNVVCARSKWCPTHRSRLQRLGSLDLPPKSYRPTAQGYMFVRIPGHPLAQASRGRQWVLEHRAVLYDHIGPGEHPCHWCGQTVSWDKQFPRHPDGLVVDHLDDDRAHNVPQNLVPSCSPCNANRGKARAV